MNTCPNCHAELQDDALYCPVCGTAVHVIIPNTAPIPEEPVEFIPPEPEFNPYDHTEQFDPEEAAATKLVCMLVYLLDFVGIIIGLLAAKESEYTAFHIKQSMKFTVVEILIAAVTLLLCWTVIVPILALIAIIVLAVIKFVSFTQVCGGKAVEPVLIRSIKFLN